MPTLRLRVSLFLTCAATACSSAGGPPVEIPAPSAAAPIASVAQAPASPIKPAAPPGAGQPCERDADCPSGQSCHGDVACGSTWTCVPALPCTRDLATFCGCDGQNFRGSSSCPPKPYRHKGGC